jgi:hypothetical protein
MKHKSYFNKDKEYVTPCNCKKIFGYPACKGHIAAPQRYMFSSEMTRVCKKCGRQFEFK